MRGSESGRHEFASVAECARVLVIDDDVPAAELFRRELDDAGFDVSVVDSGRRGLAAAEQHRFGAILLDLRLPDLDGLEVLRMLRAKAAGSRVVMVSGHLSVKATVTAIRLGASDVLEKPVARDQLVSAIASAVLGSQKQASEPRDADRMRVTVTSGVAHRWAMYVVKGCRADEDLKTVDTWSRRVAASNTTLSEICRLLGIKPQAARDLTRALSAIIRSAQLECPPAVLLDIADSRTLRAFMRRAGVGFQSADGMDSIDRFLDGQEFVSPQNPGLRILRKLLSDLVVHRVA